MLTGSKDGSTTVYERVHGLRSGVLGPAVPGGEEAIQQMTRGRCLSSSDTGAH